MASAHASNSQIAPNATWATKSFTSKGGPFSFVYGGKPSAELLPLWRFKEQKGKSRILTWTDPATGLEVKAVVLVYEDTPGVDWTLTFTNKATKDTPILEHVRAVDVADHPAQAGEAVLHRLNGGCCRTDDWMPFDQPLAAGQTLDFAAEAGRSSNVCPFFNLDWKSGGVITAIGWSGQWSASVGRGPEDAFRVRAGMEFLHTILHPGESIRSPRILQMRWNGGDQFDAYNDFRRTMLAYVMPKIAGRFVTPPITTNSPWVPHNGGDPMAYMYGFTAAQALKEIEELKGLGYEFYWTDAYYTKGNFPNGMGNYGLPLLDIVPDRARFPEGLRPISDAAHKMGLGYVVWFEPERVAPGTYIAANYPQFVISPSGNGSGLFDLGDPQARAYMTHFLDTAIAEWGMDCLRIDYNIDPLPFWQFMDAKDPNRAGISEIRYVEGLYTMWDDLRKAHPKLFIDNCASGGRRIDLETSSRSIALWRSDATIDPFIKLDYDQVALQNQVMSAGLNRYIPWSTTGNIGAEPYHFRSGFNCGMSLDEEPIPSQHELLRAAIAEGKRIRKYWTGDFYPLTPVTLDPADWCVWQYNRPSNGDGIVMAFRRPKAPPAFKVVLRGIDTAAAYSVSFSFGYEPSKPARLAGSALQTLILGIKECPGSVLIEYRKLPANKRRRA